ncbi:Hypothetical predicted protein [Mytilus galloprovincialis]|uniref:Uncharacterized protein n=1 Tax=Mytilus galloprovincialis TaxID=29158 RepID=A0A8B6C9P4_MYTGA|nr:Hypothetical predicted protein [Mytilus galloprovincialis]
MEKYFKLIVFAIVLVFYVLTLAEAQKLKSCPRSASNANRTNDTEAAPSPGDKPDKPLRVARSSIKSKRPSDYSETLRQFKCHCHKNIADVTKIQPNYLDVCPAKTAIFTTGSWFGRCWVDWPFRRHHCPWTRCVNYNRCSHVKPRFGNSWCVNTQYKTVFIYLLCWEGSHWKYRKVSFRLPTCCGCRVYC